MANVLDGKIIEIGRDALPLPLRVLVAVVVVGDVIVGLVVPKARGLRCGHGYLFFFRLRNIRIFCVLYVRRQKKRASTLAKPRPISRRISFATNSCCHGPRNNCFNFFYVCFG